MPFQTGLIGWPLGHSVSPAMHNAAFAALGLEGRYDALPVAPEEVAALVHSLPARGYRGVNVTIPHKQAIMPLMDDLSDAARAIGAVNTVIVERFSKSLSAEAASNDLGNRFTVLCGDNTDWLGFLHPLEARGFELAGKSALLLGAGGSARAVAYALAMRGVSQLAVWNRTPDRAAELAHHVAALAPALTIHQFTNSPFPISHFPFDLIVNTTPVGMWPNADASPWPDDLPFPPGALVYDLVYRPEETRFLRQAAAAGCATQGGLAMLVAQGAAAFEMWTGLNPPMDVMLAAAAAALRS